VHETMAPVMITGIAHNAMIMIFIMFYLYFLHTCYSLFLYDIIDFFTEKPVNQSGCVPRMWCDDFTQWTSAGGRCLLICRHISLHCRVQTSTQGCYV